MFVMDEEKGITRREVLKLSAVLGLGAVAVPKLRSPILTKSVELGGRAQAAFHGKLTLAPVYSDAELTPSAQFPVNSYLLADPGVDLGSWKLNVSGDVASPGEYTLAQVQSLRKINQNTRHICIEGWSVIGKFAGTSLTTFLDYVGASPSARFLTVECADDYYEFLDMETARHPQTLLCYEMYGAPLTAEHGAPLRLQMPTKLGYKQAKYLTKLRVTTELGKRRGYWVDLGYPAYGGL